MRKRLAIVGVFLVVAQTASPILRETPDHPAGASGGVQHNSQTNQGPAHDEPPVPQPIQSVNQQYDGSTRVGEDRPQPIAIREFPSVSVTKDWVDKSYWVFSGLLVLVGGLQVWLLWRTWKAMRKQTTQLERQVKASHDGLRAWIGIDVRENQFTVDFNATLLDKVNAVFNPSPPRFVWEMTNYGQTPAFIQKMGAKHMYTDLPVLDTMPTPTMLPIIAFIGTGRKNENPLDIEPKTLSEVEAARKFWRVVIKVEYLDAFDKTQIHQTTASFHYYIPKTEGDPVRRGFYQEIDPANNYNT